MVFSSPEFLYYFLPLTLALYFIIPVVKGSFRYKNILLLISGLIFYAWGEPVYVFLMTAQIIAAWGFGLIIKKCKNRKYAKILMFMSVAASLSGLLFFKYANFFVSNFNILTGMSIPHIEYIMPIGISFYTFQIISYTIDVYKEKCEVQRNILTFGTFVTSFPQLIAGPIVRYTDVMNELVCRVHSLSNFAAGARRFVIGLGKKVLLANIFGELVAVCKSSEEQSTVFTWLYVIAFSLQIYYDFSGYSDMAIGLGRIFGFKFPENFNYPYIAQNITDFWRRWHMTLSAWFRDYIYIPLGGSRGRAAQSVVCLMFVWMMTGFWHGAQWNFIIWGGYFGIVLLLERYLLYNILLKTPRCVKHLYTLFVVAVSWVIFDAVNTADAFTVIANIFGAGADEFASPAALYYLQSYTVPLITGAVGVTPLAAKAASYIGRHKYLSTVLEPAVIAAIFLFSTGAVIDSSYNPFIYFRF